MTEMEAITVLVNRMNRDQMEELMKIACDLKEKKPIDKYNSSLYLMWVNYNKLYTSFSNNLGKTWSEHEIDDYSLDEDFCISKFISNYNDDSAYNVTSVFTTNKDINIIGF